MNNTQQTTLTLIQEDYLEIAIESFLIAKKAENLTERSVKFYKEKLTIFLSYCTGQEIKHISQLTPSILREFLLVLKTTHNDGGVMVIYRSIKVFLRWYWDETEPGYPNPIAKVKTPRNDIEPLDPADINIVEKMIGACGNTLTGRRDKALMYTLLDTGLRAKELLRVRLDEISLLTGEILIAKTKSRKHRYVFLGQTSRRSIRRYLKMRKDSCPYLWVTNSGTPLSYWGLRTAIEYRAEKAGVKPPSLHSFRRFWTLTMLSKTDLVSLSRLGGWGDLQMVSRYAKQRKDDLREQASSPVDDRGQK